MLQAQINPHFLFNVLNSIRMKVLMKRDHESAEMIGSLSKLLRMTIDKNKGMVMFHEEVEINRDYVRLMNMRQKQTVDLQVDVSPDTYLIKIPRLILQPIIENAMIHGLSQKAGIIKINARIEANTLFVEVRDNGIGMNPSQLNEVRDKLSESTVNENESTTKDQAFSSIGLSNVYERMKLTFGPRFTMNIESSPGNGTVVSMHIPIERSAENV
ncbi:sensor histidine kinase [Bacillus sp. N9]